MTTIPEPNAQSSDHMECNQYSDCVNIPTTFGTSYVPVHTDINTEQNMYIFMCNTDTAVHTRTDTSFNTTFPITSTGTTDTFERHVHNRTGADDDTV